MLVVGTLLCSACVENLTAPPTGTFGPDTTGPQIRLSPRRDTTVDSIGTLLISVLATDRSGIRLLDFRLLPPTFGFTPLAPLDTVFGAAYPIALGYFKHSTFRFYVYAQDILDHETITDTVVVTVR